MKKPLIITVLALMLAAMGFSILFSREEVPAVVTPMTIAQVPEGATVITLTEDGFTPRELTISKGTLVAFVSKTGKLFWPASNLHPSHGMYSEFDPKLPVQSDEVWSFTFDQVGEWKYHDHLAPYYVGVITVTK